MIYAFSPGFDAHMIILPEEQARHWLTSSFALYILMVVGLRISNGDSF